MAGSEMGIRFKARGNKVSHSSQYIQIETASICSLIDCEKIEEMVRELVALRERGGRLFILGLGGSAANASHAVNDFRKLCDIRAYAPNDNSAELTARANDEGWSFAYANWLYAEKPRIEDDIFILSVGGGSIEKHISIPLMQCIITAKQYGMRTLGIVGRDGGYTAQNADCCIIIPTVKSERVTPHTEGWQSIILHCLVSHPDLQKAKTKW